MTRYNSGRYGNSHDIIFNYNKTVGLVHPCKKFDLSFDPKVVLCNEQIKFVAEVKYLGILINGPLLDDSDMKRQLRSLYCTANQLRNKFSNSRKKY